MCDAWLSTAGSMVKQVMIDAATVLFVWLTVEQAAARAQVGKRTIYHEVKAGRLKAARIGGRRELRFRESYIDEWLEASADACFTDASR